MIDLTKHVLRPCMTAWGERVAYHPGTGLPYHVNGVFDDRFIEQKFDPQTGMEVSTQRPSLGVLECDFLPGAPYLSEVFHIRGRLYRVVETQPDGHGHVQVHLQLATDADALRPMLPPHRPCVP